MGRVGGNGKGASTHYQHCLHSGEGAAGTVHMVAKGDPMFPLCLGNMWSNGNMLGHVQPQAMPKLGNLVLECNTFLFCVPIRIKILENNENLQLITSSKWRVELLIMLTLK